MDFIGKYFAGLVVWLALFSAMTSTARAQTTPPFEVEEATIGQVHAAIRSGRLTCRELVDVYIRRIHAYDKNGPAINAIVTINPEAEKEAAELDRRFSSSGLTGALHCVPMIVKDNFETMGLQTSDGALAFAGYIPKQDATQVALVKAAGAIVLAKSNMAEWAFSPVETVSSILPGYTKNPYALDRSTAGSSGGTAAAIAASFGLVGLGSDTGDSIRGPASHQALAGIRSTMGRTSRAGVFPLNLRADIAGPLARTMEDAVKVFQVIAAEDPRDAATVAAQGHPPPDYSRALDKNGLRGAGAAIIDPAKVEGLEAVKRQPGVAACMGFKHDLNQFLLERAGLVPFADLTAILKSGKFHPSVQKRLEDAENGPANGPDSDACKADAAYRQQFGDAVLKTMDRLKLDAFVYPTWSNPPRLIGDLNTPAGDNSQVFSPTTGFPAINVPMGYSRGGTLPAGITFYGRAWSEAQLIQYAYAYEQATQHRRAPVSTPPLR
jgi:amidase